MHLQYIKWQSRHSDMFWQAAHTKLKTIYSRLYYIYEFPTFQHILLLVPVSV